MKKEQGVKRVRINDPKEIGSLTIRDNRLWLVKPGRFQRLEIDVTPIWHFFKDMMKHQETKIITEK